MKFKKFRRILPVLQFTSKLITLKVTKGEILRDRKILVNRKIPSASTTVNIIFENEEENVEETILDNFKYQPLIVQN